MSQKVILTEEGFQNLKEELDHLVNVERREVAKRIKTARDFGDISENSEYDDAKNEQAFIEGRIQEIKNMLDNAEVVKEEEISDEIVSVGNIVKIKDVDSGKEYNYKIVGSAEADPLNNKISNESPIGSAIIGHKPGDTVKVEVPSGLKTYEILLIKKEKGNKRD